MDYESIKSYEGTSVKLTLLNDFWYRAKIIKVTETTVTFIEQKGRTVCVRPEDIAMALPMNTEVSSYNG